MRKMLYSKRKKKKLTMIERIGYAFLFWVVCSNPFCTSDEFFLCSEDSESKEDDEIMDVDVATWRIAIWVWGTLEYHFRQWNCLLTCDARITFVFLYFFWTRWWLWRAWGYDYNSREFSHCLCT